MFPRTAISEKAAKNRLTCSHVQMVSKMARRHQFHQLQPCGVRDIDVKAINFDFTGLAGLHSSYPLELKCQNAYMGTYRGCIFVRNSSPKLGRVELTDYITYRLRRQNGCYINLILILEIPHDL